MSWIFWTVFWLCLAGGLVWVTIDYAESRDKVRVYSAALYNRDQIIAMKNETIAGYKEAATSWKDRYEQLRWQQRIAPPPPAGRR